MALRGIWTSCLLAATVLVSGTTLSCRTTDTSVVKDVPAASQAGPKLCAAIQGNGQAIFGHFHSLAHIISHYGLFDAAAGSSSASITMFLLESMLQNPAIANCNCSADEKAQRVALMLKSVVGFFDLSSDRTEATSLYSFASILKELAARGVGANPAVPTPDLNADDFRHFQTVLGTLYNPRFGELFAQSPAKDFHLQDYKKSLSAGAFVVDSDRVFLRPFPITFDGIAVVVGWVGNFYAGRGYDNAAHWNDWLATCNATATKDQTWGQIAYANYDAQHLGTFFAPNAVHTPTACLEKYKVLIADYQAMDQTTPPANNRIDEPVGKYLATIPITGLVVGGGTAKIEAAQAAYWQAKDVPDLNIDYDQEFRVGYYGSSGILDTVAASVAAAKAAGPIDVKTEKFFPLPGMTWRNVLSTSPAEPSISEAVVLEPNKLTSVGGWADPFPSTVLKLAGCQNVFFITTVRDSFGLLNDVGNLLGAARSAKGRTFVDSSLQRGLKDADAVWCTNWNDYTDYLSLQNVYDLSDKTFVTGFETASPFFLQAGGFGAPASTHHFGCNNL